VILRKVFNMTQQIVLHKWTQIQTRKYFFKYHVLIDKLPKSTYNFPKSLLDLRAGPAWGNDRLSWYRLPILYSWPWLQKERIPHFPHLLSLKYKWWGFLSYCFLNIK